MRPLPRQAFIGVGANLGDRWATITKALIALAHSPGITALETSAVFETVPVGVTDQPQFLNLVVGVETILYPESLFELLLTREQAAGRNRARETRWGPRTLDLDLLLFENEIRADPGLQLPHPRLWERPFVLAPLSDLLTRRSRFHRPCWAEIRIRLAQTNFSRDGITPWTPTT